MCVRVRYVLCIILWFARQFLQLESPCPLAISTRLEASFIWFVKGRVGDVRWSRGNGNGIWCIDWIQRRAQNSKRTTQNEEFVARRAKVPPQWPSMSQAEMWAVRTAIMWLEWESKSECSDGWAGPRMVDGNCKWPDRSVAAIQRCQFSQIWHVTMLFFFVPLQALCNFNFCRLLWCLRLSLLY